MVAALALGCALGARAESTFRMTEMNRMNTESDLGKWYWGMTPGFMWFEHDMNVRNTGYGALHFGYDYDRVFSFEFGALVAPSIQYNKHAKHGEPHWSAEGLSYEWTGRGQMYGLYTDALMHLDRYNRWFDPYLLVGAGVYGSTERIFGDNHMAFVPRLGVGVMSHVTEKLTLRADAIAQCLVNDDTEFAGGFEVGLVYHFGGDAEPAKAKPVTVETPQGVRVDTDGDGLFDDEEIALGTNPKNPDSDNDGLTDYDEVRIYGTDPLNPDTDGDGLTDSEEVKIYGTDPLKWDTDGGGVSDGHEVLIDKTNPLDPKDDLLKFEFGMLFAYDTATIQPQYFGDLDKVVEVLQNHPAATALIEGHTDRRAGSSASYNKDLSVRRAKAVEAYFVKKGVDTKRLKSEGWGFEKPKVKPDLIKGNPENRRVEVYIKGVERPTIKR